MRNSMDTLNPTFVILTKNSVNLVTKLLDQLKDTVQIEHETIVVDSASTDGTVNILKERNDIQLLTNYVNISPGKAMNQALRIIDSESIVVKLDSDIELLKGWVEPLLFSSLQPNTGIVGACLLYPNGNIQHSGGIVYSKQKYPEKKWRFDCCQIPSPSGISIWVSGACFLITPKARHAVKFFDERYPFWFDDIDYCFSVRNAGLLVRYCQEAILIHHENSSTNIRPEVYTSHELFIKKWEGIEHLWELENNSDE